MGGEGRGERSVGAEGGAHGHRVQRGDFGVQIGSVRREWVAFDARGEHSQRGRYR